MVKIKSLAARLLSACLLMVSLIGGILAAETMNTIEVHAATATLSVGASVRYGNWSTHYFSVNGGSNNAYCVEPAKSTPSAGTYDAEEITDRQAMLTSAVFASLYAPGHLYGMKGSNGKDVNSLWVDNGCTSLEDIYITSHILISYYYSNLFAADGISTTWKQGLSQAEQQRIVSIAEQLQLYYMDGYGTIDQDGFHVYRIRNNSQDIIYWEYEPKGKAKLKKTNDNPALTEGNSCYSLAGATYTIYEDAGCTKAAGTLTTKEDGSTNEISLKAGTYYVLETKASKGYFRDPAFVRASEGGSGPKRITVTSGQTTEFTSKEPPGNDPVLLILQKGDASTGKPYAQGDAGLEGAEYTVRFYGDLNSGDHKNARPLRTWVFRTNAKGVINCTEEFKVGGDPLYRDRQGMIVFPLGTITFQETKAPEGYLINPEILVAQTTERGNGFSTINLPTESTRLAKETVIAGGLRIAKVDSELSEYFGSLNAAQGIAQGDATLNGVVFEIINKSKASVMVGGKETAPGGVCLEISTVFKNGMFMAETPDRALPYGTYRIREKSTSTGYLFGEIFDSSARGYSTEDGRPGYNFEIRNDGEWIDYTNNPVGNPPIRGGVTINKVDVEYWQDLKAASKAQGDATLEGTVFEIVNNSTSVVLVDGNLYNPGNVVMTLTSDANGFVSTSADALPYGTYTIREKTEPTGYLHDGHSGHNAGNRLEVQFQIREHGKIVDLTGTPIENPVIRGGIEIEKWDAEFDVSQKKQGDATLGGAVFAIINESINPVKVDGKYYNPGETVKEITTNEAGLASTDNHCLPYGTYRIIEIKAPEGYLNTVVDNYGVLERTFKIREEDEGRIINLTLEDERFEGEDFGPIKNEPIRGGVQIAKRDIETKLSEAIGGKDHTETELRGATLEGIEFSIWNISAKYPSYGNSILSPYSPDPETIREGEVEKREGTYTWNELINGMDAGFVTTISMTWNEEQEEYTAQTGPRDLPYGTYLLAETKANDSYILSDRSVWTFEVREDSVIVKDSIQRIGGIKDAITSESGNTITEIINGTPVKFERDASLTAYDRIRRNDIEFEKIADTISKRLHVAFAITNESTGETHVLVTNENGEAATHIDMGDYENTGDVRDVKFPPHTWETNGNDHLLTDYSEDNPIPTSELNTKAGIWFGLTEGITGDASDGTMAIVNDNLGALPFGLYTLRELRCEENVGYILQEFTFRVNANKSNPNELGTDLGTVTDDPTDTPPEEEPEPDPEIGTMARDKDSGTNVGIVSENSVIIDTVSFKNLVPGREYRLLGVIMDKETGEPLRLSVQDEEDDSDSEDAPVFDIGTPPLPPDDDSTIEGEGIVAPDGETNDNAEDVDSDESQEAEESDTNEESEPSNEGLITAEITFIPETADGTIEIEFPLDTRDLAWKSIVVFEKLFYGEDEIASHEDIEDEGQTVTFEGIPEIGTKAHDKESGTNLAKPSKTTTIIDVVSFRNLKIGAEYELVGIIMRKDTGESLLDKDGNPYQCKEKFTPDAHDGEMSISFDIDSSELAGKSIVVFEKLFLEEVEVAVHEDIEDEGQTVTFEKPGKPETPDEPEPEKPDKPKEPEPKKPVIGTKARDKESGTNIGVASGSAIIIDTVKYSGLEPGKEYKMVGVLMVKETKKPLTDKNGKNITAELIFTPEKESGEVELEFPLDASKLGGKSVVVFEKLFLKDTEIASHEDIDDADQTVTYEEPKEPEKPNEPEKPDKPDTPDKPTEPEKPNTPKTADSTIPVTLFIGLSFILGAALILIKSGVIGKIRKWRRNG